MCLRLFYWTTYVLDALGLIYSGLLYCHYRAPSPEQEEPSEERDKRTVMCMQLAAKVGKHELEEFFASLGKKVSYSHYDYGLLLWNNLTGQISKNDCW